jgi:hypothetical protein
MDLLKNLDDPAAATESLAADEIAGLRDKLSQLQRESKKLQTMAVAVHKNAMEIKKISTLAKNLNETLSAGSQFSHEFRSASVSCVRNASLNQSVRVGLQRAFWVA